MVLKISWFPELICNISGCIGQGRAWHWLLEYEKLTECVGTALQCPHIGYNSAECCILERYSLCSLCACSLFCSAFGIGVQGEELSALSSADEQEEVLKLVRKGFREKLLYNILTVIDCNWNTVKC